MILVSRLAYVLFLLLAAILGVEAYGLLNAASSNIEYKKAQGLQVDNATIHLTPPGSFARVQEFAMTKADGIDADVYGVTFDLAEHLHGTYELDLSTKHQSIALTCGAIEAEIVQCFDAETCSLEKIRMRDHGSFDIQLNELTLRTWLDCHESRSDQGFEASLGLPL